ncbi:MAG: sodium:solute symporter family transporter [Leptonema sp. (in: bacteria)]
MFWVLPILYFLFLLFLTIKGITKEKTDSAYFFDSHKTNWFYSLISLIATETSVATILIFPSLGFQKNFNIFFLCLGYIVGRFIVAFYYLKHYHKLSSLSLYEHISEENSHNYLSFAYLVAKYISGSIRFFLAAFGMYQLTEVSIIFWLILIALFVALYSGTGGLKSVILTDQLQGWIVFLSAVFFILYLNENYSFSLSLEKDLSQNIEIKNSLILFFGSLLITISTHGGDQDLLQRIFSIQNYKKARLSLFLSGFVASIIILLFFYIGYTLFFIEKLNPKSPLLDFINRLPETNLYSDFTKSLFFVVLLAASMSTLDSSIHSTGAIWKAILRKKISIKNYYYSLFSLVLMLFFAFLFIEMEKYKDFFSLAFGFMNFINGALFSFITLYVIFKKKLQKNLVIIILFWNILAVVICESLNLFWASTTIISFFSSLMLGLLIYLKKSFNKFEPYQ